MKSKSLFIIFIFVSLTFLMFGCGNKAKSSSLPDFKENLNISVMNKVSMFALARKALALYPDMDRALALPVEKGLPNICDKEVFVTVFHEGSPQITGAGTQGCMQERLLLAVTNLTNSPDFKSHYLLNLETVSVKIDILYRRNLIDTSKPLGKIKIEPGIEGLILQDGQRMHYQLPTDFIHYGWEPDEPGRSWRESRNEIMFKYLCRQAGHGLGAYKSYLVYKFRTISLLQLKADILPLPLFRGNLLRSEYKAADMARGAVAAGDWLIKNIELTGRFTYQYNPATGEKSSFLDYNVIRHAGCVYSLLYLYNQTLEPRFLEQGMVSLKFLQRHLQKPLLEPELLAVRHPVYGTYALGTTALTLMALCELPEAQFEKIGVDTTNRLARFLLKMQMDNGNFNSIYIRKLAGLKDSKTSQYATGEALLALIRYYNRNPNIDWLEAANKAAAFQIEQFNSTGKVNSWTIQGLAELFKIDPNPKYSQAVFDMADILLESQFSEEEKIFSDYTGGFNVSRPPRSKTASSRSEALIAARNLSWFLGKSGEKYDKAILLAARFILWNQYWSDNSYFISLPDLVEGAISGGLSDPKIRMDNCQHAIVALTGAYKIANQLEEEKAGSNPADKANKSNKSK